MDMFNSSNENDEQRDADEDEEEDDFPINKSFSRRNPSISNEANENSLLNISKEGQLTTIYEKNSLGHKNSGDINHKSNVLMTQRYMEEMSIPRPREQFENTPNGSVEGTPVPGGQMPRMGGTKNFRSFGGIDQQTPTSFSYCISPRSNLQTVAG